MWACLPVQKPAGCIVDTEIPHFFTSMRSTSEKASMPCLDTLYTPKLWKGTRPVNNMVKLEINLMFK